MNKPTLPLYLIKWLEEQYPEVNPSPSTSMEQIQFRAGQRDVVLRIIREFDSANNRSLI